MGQPLTMHVPDLLGQFFQSLHNLLLTPGFLQGKHILIVIQCPSHQDSLVFTMLNTFAVVDRVQSGNIGFMKQQNTVQFSPISWYTAKWVSGCAGIVIFLSFDKQGQVRVIL